MAKMTMIKAGSEYARKISRLGAQGDEIAKKALYEAAAIVADRIKSNLHAVLEGSAEATGALEESFGITPMKTDDAGNWTVKIGFDGYDSKGAPNQLKARVLEKGSSHVRARPYARRAVNATKAQAIEKMGKIIDEEIEKIMR